MFFKNTTGTEHPFFHLKHWLNKSTNSSTRNSSSGLRLQENQKEGNEKIPSLHHQQAKLRWLHQVPIYFNRLNSVLGIRVLCAIYKNKSVCLCWRGNNKKYIYVEKWKKKKARMVKYHLDFIKELSIIKRTRIFNCAICYTALSSFAFILFFLQWAGKLSCFRSRPIWSAWWTAEGISAALENYINHLLSDCHFPAKCYYK